MPTASTDDARPPDEWVVVVPVKRLDSAKTRLDRSDRADAALAMATDTVRAAGASPLVASVLVVTDDPRAEAALAPLAEVVPDAPDRGLNPALEHGAATAATRRPDCGVAALAADLPALRADELTRALTAAADAPRALVADGSGTGTVLLSAWPGVPLAPHFGGGSRAAHLASGVADLTDPLGAAVPGLRRDVDTVGDLLEVSQLGPGPATRRLLYGAAGGSSVQATVRRWSPETRSGDAVTDAGELFELVPASELIGSLRGLRPGQRVRLTMAGSTSTGGGAVTTIGLVTEPLPVPAEDRST